MTNRKRGGRRMEVFYLDGLTLDRELAEKAARALYESGLNLTEIAERFGHATNTSRRLILNAGGTLRANYYKAPQRRQWAGRPPTEGKAKK